MTHNPLMSRPRVIVPDRPTFSKPFKTACWNRVGGICYLCGKPVAPEGEGVRYDHRDMREVSADDSPENIFPTHTRCHAVKTEGPDAKRLSKTRGMEKLTKAKVRKPGGFRGWRKMDGTIVYRDRES